MRSPTHKLFATTFALIATLLTGCAGRPTHRAPSSTHTSSPSSAYSSLIRTIIDQHRISDTQLQQPESLESSSVVAEISPEETRLLLLSEAFLDRASTAPHGAAIDPLLRSAHFAYEGLLSPGCATLDSDQCKLLSNSYRQAVMQIATATSFGTIPLTHTDNDRYVLDFEGDDEPLSPTEWSFSRPTSTTLSREGLGAPIVACRRAEGAPSSATPTTCVPATFVLHFDAPARDGGTRAHLVAHNAFDHSTIGVHGRELPLAADLYGVWDALLGNDAPLTCLGELLPNAAAVVLLVDNSPARSDWAKIGESLALDTTVTSVYNLCAHHSAQSPELSTVLAQSLRTGHETTSVVLVSQGADNDHTASILASRMRGENLSAKKSGIRAPLAVAGTLSVPARGRTRTSSADSATTRSHASVLAERDIKRLLTRLIEEDLVPLPSQERDTSNSSLDISLSPVM